MVELCQPQLAMQLASAPAVINTNSKETDHARASGGFKKIQAATYFPR